MLQSPYMPTAERLLELMRRAHKMDGARYDAQWKPYLASFELPIFKMWRWGEVSTQMLLLPERASVMFTYPMYQPYQSIQAEWSWLLNQVTHLKFIHQKDHKTTLKQALCQSFARLRVLEVWSSDVLDDDLSLMVSSGTFAQLEHLCVHSNKLTDAFVIQLIDEGSTQLQYLNLSANALTDRGLNALLETHRFPNLTHLYVYNHSFGVDVRSRVESRGGLVNLKDLGVVYP